MEDANVACPSAAIRPVEGARVNTDVHGIDWVGYTRFFHRPRLLHRAEIIPPLSHRRQEIRSDGSPIPHISHHHGFLHRPSIVADDKTSQALVAVLAARRMILVYRFAFSHKGIVSDKNWKRVPIQEKNQVWHLV